MLTLTIGVLPVKFISGTVVLFGGTAKTTHESHGTTFPSKCQFIISTHCFQGHFIVRPLEWVE